MNGWKDDQAAVVMIVMVAANTIGSQAVLDRLSRLRRRLPPT